MIYDVNQQELVLEISKTLKEKELVAMPEWANFIKTGSHRETMPKNPDWWYIRSASILRFVMKSGPVGVSKLRTRYGGRKNRGFKPDRFVRAGGKVLRVILQQLEKSGLVKQAQVESHKGREVTPKGASIIAIAAKVVHKNTPAEPVAKSPKKSTKKVEESVATEEDAVEIETKPVSEKAKKPSTDNVEAE